MMYEQNLKDEATYQVQITRFAVLSARDVLELELRTGESWHLQLKSSLARLGS